MGSEGSTAERTVATFALMGTVATITLPGDGDRALIAEAYRMLRHLEARITVNGGPARLAASQVAAINAAAGRAAVAVDPDVYELVAAAVLASRAHRDSFNALLGPVIKAWRIGFADARVPEPAELAGLLARTDPDEVELDPQRHRVALRKPGMALDLGAIAKGYAADRVAGLCRARGHHAALIDLGGNVVALGSADRHLDGRWQVGIQSPFGPPGELIAVLGVRDSSAVTSGIYERQLVDGDVCHHHMIDPITGRPFDTDLASVTVVAASSMQADLWATIAQRGGSAVALAEIDRHPGLEAVLVTRNQRVLASHGLAGRLRVIGPAGFAPIG